MKTRKVLKISYVFTWVVFIGFIIKAISTLTTYVISLFNPSLVKDLFQDINLLAYKQYDLFHYTSLVVYIFLKYSLQAYIAFLVIKLLSKININKPFNTNTLRIIQKINYCTLLLWLLVVIYNMHVGLIETSSGISPKLLSSEFIYIVGILYVFSFLFKRGLELQSENDLTI
jgi:hypothetical protein